MISRTKINTGGGTPMCSPKEAHTKSQLNHQSSIFHFHSQYKQIMDQMKRSLMKFLVSISLLSFFVLCYSSSSSSSSSGFSSSPNSSGHHFNIYFSTYLLSILAHTLERKYMFLICNGILAFLAKTGLNKYSSTNCSSIYDDTDESLSPLQDFGAKSSPSSFSEICSPIDHHVASHHEGEEQPTSSTEQVAEEVEEEEEEDLELEEEQNGSLHTENHEEVPEAFITEGDGSGTPLTNQGEEDMEAAELATNANVNGDEYYLTTSTDELNKKFEEFIRKMKKEIRIEAQRQPIAV